MRRTFNPQLELGATPIEDIRFNARSRDDIPQLLAFLNIVQALATCSSDHQARLGLKMN